MVSLLTSEDQYTIPTSIDVGGNVLVILHIVQPFSFPYKWLRVGSHNYDFAGGLIRGTEIWTWREGWEVESFRLTWLEEFRI